MHVLHSSLFVGFQWRLNAIVLLCVCLGLLAIRCLARRLGLPLCDQWPGWLSSAEFDC